MLRWGWSLKASATHRLASRQVEGGCLSSRSLPLSLLQLSSCPLPGGEVGECRCTWLNSLHIHQP